jgi:hypothetical protein
MSDEKKITIVFGNPFVNDSPRMRQGQARMLIEKAGLRPSLWRRLVKWLGIQ